MHDEEQVEQQQEENPAGMVNRWLKELAASDRHEQSWRKRSRDLIDVYRNDADPGETTKQGYKFNILYANTEVLMGVLYHRPPIPDVRRRFLESEGQGRLNPNIAGKRAAEVIERALSFAIDAYDFDRVAEKLVLDVLLPGRGVAYASYEPTFATTQQPVMDEMGMPAIGEDGQPAMEEVEELVYEEVKCEHVQWDMFRYSPARSWDKVRWIAFGELLTRDELVDQFGDVGQQTSLTWSPERDDAIHPVDDTLKRALVWTIWDKTTRRVIMVSDGNKQQPLRVLDDPLRLEGFFPTPEPLLGIFTTSSLIPVPEFFQYQNQAIELEETTRRIEDTLKRIKTVGVYDGQFSELSHLLNAPDGDLTAVENFAALVERGGIDSVVGILPIKPYIEALVQLVNHRAQVKEIIYEITGIADIVRGSTKASETLGAQEMKSRYANSRIGNRQKAIQRYLRDLLRIKAEIISEHFEPQTLQMMTGQIVDEEVLQILRNDKLRGFSVDIETDSTVMPDQVNEQRNRVEFLGATVQFMQGMAPLVAQGSIPIELAKELFLFAARAFKLPRQLEEAFESIGAKKDPQMEQMQQQKAVAMGVAEVEQAQADVAETRAKTQKAIADAAKAAREGMAQPGWQ